MESKSREVLSGYTDTACQHSTYKIVAPSFFLTLAFLWFITLFSGEVLQAISGKAILSLSGEIFSLFLLGLLIAGRLICSSGSSSGRIGNSLILSGCIMLFMLVSTLQIFNNNVPHAVAGLEGFRKTAFHFIAFIIGVLWPKKNTEQSLKILWWLSLIPLFYAIKQYLWWTNIDSLIANAMYADKYTLQISGIRRVFSIFAGPFHLGMFGVLMFAISVFLLYRTRSIKYLIGAVVSVISILLSATRTNVISLIAVFAVLVFTYQMSLRNTALKLQALPKKILLLSFFMVIAILIFIVISPGIRQTGSELINKLSVGYVIEDQRFLGRIEGWKLALNDLERSPFFGYGMGSAGDTLHRKYNFKNHVTSHNLFLKMLYETGLFGFILFSLFLISLILVLLSHVFRASPPQSSISSLAIAALMNIFVNGLVGSAIEGYPINILTWWIVGLAVSKWAPTTCLNR